MGTSYYLYLKCNYDVINNLIKNDKLINIDKYDLLSCIRIKIGKNSAGWKFCLHIYPLLNINTFEDWKDIFKNEKFIIVDEYNEVIPINEMINIISKKERFYKKEDTGKTIDTKYIISEVGLLKHSFPGFKVIENETYDYLICENG
mgnify:CR=1 FL=1